MELWPCFRKVNVNTGFSPGWTAGENKDLLTECAQLKGWTVAKEKREGRRGLKKKRGGVATKLR